MGDIVNLRRARKRQVRAQENVEAAARRARFGVAPALRRMEQVRLELAAKQLDGRRLDPRGSARSGDED
jgi:hypothetical protein